MDIQYVKLPITLTRDEADMRFILAVLNHKDGNRTHAAKSLGISLRCIRNRLREAREQGFVVIESLHYNGTKYLIEALQEISDGEREG